MARSKAAKKKERKGNAVIRYIRDTRAELRKVHWPSRQEAWSLTKIVLAVTISMAIFLGLLDYLFALELTGIIAQESIALGIAVAVVVMSAVVGVVLSRRRA